jgi:SAM-dependent methyltransferase
MLDESAYKHIYNHQKSNKNYIIRDDMTYVKEKTLRLINQAIMLPAKHLSLNPKILDFGCRTGYYMQAISRDNPKCETFGIEILPEYVEVGLARGRTIVHGDATYCHEYFPESYFDGVIALHALEHLEDPHLALTNLRLVVKPKARCLLVVPLEGKGVRLSFTAKSKDKPKHRCQMPTEAAVREAIPKECWDIQFLQGSWEVILVAK